MNKPITMIIKDTKMKLANACNESGLSPAILDLIVHDIYAEVHSIAERQAIDEEKAYLKMIENEASNASNSIEE